MTSDELRRPSAIEGLLGVIAVYTFAGWAYIAGNAMAHPDTLGKRLTHFAAWPHEDTFGAVCFLVSFLAAATRTVLRSRR
jgi:hypothetical protein